VRVAIAVAALPLLPQAAQLAAEGVASSLAPANRDAAEAAELGAGVAALPAFPLVFDPQTGGGLLAGVPAERAEAALAALRAGGYPHAAAVGLVLPTQAGARPLLLRTML
jgi:selenide,water dikinase